MFVDVVLIGTLIITVIFSFSMLSFRPLLVWLIWIVGSVVLGLIGFADTIWLGIPYWMYFGYLFINDLKEQYS